MACPRPSRRRPRDSATAGLCPFGRADWGWGRSSIALQIHAAFLAAEIAADRFVDTAFDSGAVTNDTAVRPFDAAIVWAETGLRQKDKTAGIAALFREFHEMRARAVDQRVGQANGDMRRGTDLREYVDHELLDFRERLARGQRRR